MKWKKKKNQKEERLEESNSSRSIGLYLLLILHTSLFAAPSFYFTPKLIDAQGQNYELKLSGSRKILQAEKAVNADNFAIDYLLHFNYFLEAFVTEEQAHYTAYQVVLKKSIANFEKLSDTFAYKKFALSEAYFYAAILQAKHNDLYAAARDIKKAYTLVEENHKKFPKFLPNNKTRGIIKAYMSTVPASYAWVVKILGVKGDLDGGLRLLQGLAYSKSTQPEHKLIAQEAGYLYAYALYNVAKQPNKSWAEMQNFTKDHGVSLLSVFFRSQIALKLNRNDAAIKTLEGKPTGNEYISFLFLDYLHGIAKLNRQDADAIKPLLNYYTKFKGQNNIKSCLEKMSWYYLLAGDHAKYETYKKLILTEGVAINEEDKQAERYANKPKPDRYLLKARLLYDGGYYDKALKTLDLTNINSLKSLNEKAEFCYRKGRIYERLGNMPVALKFYEACGIYAINSTEYYGAYASLYIADYYLSKGDKVKAKQFYTKALDFKQNKEYTDSIDLRAKTGLKKC